MKRLAGHYTAMRVNIPSGRASKNPGFGLESTTLFKKPQELGMRPAARRWNDYISLACNMQITKPIEPRRMHKVKCNQNQMQKQNNPFLLPPPLSQRAPRTSHLNNLLEANLHTEHLSIGTATTTTNRRNKAPSNQLLPRLPRHVSTPDTARRGCRTGDRRRSLCRGE
jgi:hypothetical protein